MKESKESALKSFIKNYTRDSRRNTIIAWSTTITVITFNSALIQTINFLLPESGISRIIAYWILWFSIILTQLSCFCCMQHLPFKCGDKTFEDHIEELQSITIKK